jgi:hypothetical protein
MASCVGRGMILTREKRNDARRGSQRLCALQPAVPGVHSAGGACALSRRVTTGHDGTVQYYQVLSCMSYGAILDPRRN